jgi:colicin import membrane protein
VRFSLPVSFLLHAGLLAWAFIHLERTKPFKLPEPEPVEVAIITEDGLTRLTKGDRSAKKLEAAPAPPAPESKVVKEIKKPKPPEPTAPPPPPPEPAKAEPPPPPKAESPPEPKRDEIAEKLAMLPPEPKGPTPEELAKQEAERKAAEAKAEEERKQAEAKKKADEKRKKELAEKRRKELAEKRRKELEKKKREEAKRLAELKKQQQKRDDFESVMQRALLDKDPTRRPPPTGGSDAFKTAERGPVAGAPDGKDTRLTASQISLLGAMMKQQVAKCWNINSGAEGVERIRIEVEVKLRPDGRLSGQPRVVSRGSGPLYADMANSALRALVQCEPYDLPKQLYKGGWDFMIVEFDPSRMY